MDEPRLARRPLTERRLRALLVRDSSASSNASSSSASSSERPTIGDSSRARARGHPARVDDAVGGHPLGLALQLERFELLDGDRVAHEPVRRLADHDLPRLRALLEPGGDVDHVAGRHVLPVGLSPPTTSPVLTPVRVSSRARSRGSSSSLTIASADRASTAAGPLRAHRPRAGREAEDGDQRVAGELLERAAVTGNDGRDLAEVAREGSAAWPRDRAAHRAGSSP